MGSNQNSTLGELVRHRRMAKDLSLRELARRLDRAPSYLNDIEHNRRIPSEAVLRQICEVLELDVDEMLSVAGRLGEDAEHYLKRNPTAGVLFRRVSQGGLGEQELKELITEVDRLERKRPQEPPG